MDRLAIMEAAAREAGRFMLGADKLTAATQKSTVKDFVTVADIKSQDILRSRLHEAYPDAIILSEEDDEAARAPMYEADFTGFVLDPIDGTYNFKRDQRESAISIGYIEAGQSVAGVIYDPYKDELYKAVKGGGAVCNEQPITVSDRSDLAATAVAFSNSYDDAAMARNLRRHLAIYEQTGQLPWTDCPGSGVLIMAWVARGRIDAYHHNGIKPWDNAAAFVIAAEAGAKICNLKGEAVTFTTPTLLIGSPTIVDQLLAIFTTISPELLT